MGLPKNLIPVVETFTSIQGEGRNLGQPYIFVRVGGCPLRCRFCDSEYTWTPKQDEIVEVGDLAQKIGEEIERTGIRWVSITGGEPLIYPRQISVIMQSVPGWFHIETSGRYYDKEVHNLSDIWSMDIKTPCTNEVQERDLVHLKMMRAQDQVKCLIESEEDVEYAARVREMLGGSTPLILQPFNVNVDNESDSKNDILIGSYRWLVEKVLANPKVWPNVIVSPQVHVLLWGNKRGV